MAAANPKVTGLPTEAPSTTVMAANGPDRIEIEMNEAAEVVPEAADDERDKPSTKKQV